MKKENYYIWSRIGALFLGAVLCELTYFAWSAWVELEDGNLAMTFVYMIIPLSMGITFVLRRIMYLEKFIAKGGVKD